MTKKNYLSKQRIMAMMIALVLILPFCWGMSVLKADAYSASIYKFWYYDTSTRTYKSSGSTSDAVISLSSGASDLAHVMAVVTLPSSPYDRVTYGNQFTSTGTKYFAYLNPSTAGNAYYIVGMCLSTDSGLSNVNVTFTFTP